MRSLGMVLLLVVSGILAGCTSPQEWEESVYVTTVPEGLETSPRFLKQVPVPEHLLTRPTYEDGEKRPGDGYTDDLLKTQRRITDRSYRDKPLTNGFTLSGLVGTADNPVCICDVEFVFENKAAQASPPRLDIKNSVHVLIDNVTVYGGGILFHDSDHVTVTRSRFIDSGGISSWTNTNNGLVYDNDFISNFGPMHPYDHPPVYERCWPDTVICGGTGVALYDGDRWTIEHNHFDGVHGVGGTGGPTDVQVHHNSFYNSGGILLTGGRTEATWNLMRGWGLGNIFSGGSAESRIENNSIVLEGKIDHRDHLIDQQPGVLVVNCKICTISNNDFIGFGLGYQNRGGGRVMIVETSTIYADGNYWGSLTDPREPNGVWIWNVDDSPIDIAHWRLEPQHPLDEAVVTPYYEDAGFWAELIVEDPTRLIT